MTSDAATLGAVREALRHAARVALEEDLGENLALGDATTRATVPQALFGEATVVAKQPGVLCGVDAFEATYEQLSAAGWPAVSVEARVSDSARLDVGQTVAVIEGPVATILTGERTSLNMACHLSGIATLTSAFVQRAGPDVRITETRKTLPGLRALQKYAVTAGGGINHRFALYDGVLVKDNHIAAAGGVAAATRAAKAQAAGLSVQVECSSRRDVDEAIDEGADRILLDNLSAGDLRRLAAHISRRAPHIEIEATGGVVLSNVAEIAATGVHRISIGALTHSAPALDLSMNISRSWR